MRTMRTTGMRWCLAAAFAWCAVSGAVRAQVEVTRTVVVDKNVPDNGTLRTGFTWANAGVSLIDSVSVTLNLSSPFSSNPIELSDLSGSIRHGLSTEAFRTASLFSAGSLNSLTQTFAQADGLVGAWLGSGYWRLDLTDSRGGGVARLDNFTFSVRGTAATGGTLDVGQGGVIAASGEGTQEISAAITSSGAGTNGVVLQSDAGKTLQVTGGLQGEGEFRKSGSGVLRLEGASTNFTGKVVVESGAVEIASSSALGQTGSLEIAGTNTTVRLANAVVVSNTMSLGSGVSARIDGGGTLAGGIAGTGGIVKEGTNAVTIAGSNSYTGTTAVTAGKLIVAQGASLASSTATVTNNDARLVVNGDLAGAATVSGGGVIGGSGTIGSLTVADGGLMAPGNSAGTLTATNGATWSQGGIYDWEIFDLAGPAGTGWDLLDVTGGTLDLTGITTAGGYTINLITLQGDNLTQGALGSFDPAANYSNWLIARAPTISGFDASLFSLNSASFVGATGTFGITLMDIEGDDGLFLTYSAPLAGGVPEPGTWAAAVLLLLAAGYARWRRGLRA